MFRVVFIIPALLCFGQGAFAARIYFTDQPAGGASGSVMSVAPDGTDQRTVITASAGSDLRGIAYHTVSGRIYYLDNGTAKKIYSILTNGTSQTEITPLGGTFNADLEIDELTNKVYWSETGSGLIKRANLNGTSVETVVTPGTGSQTQPYFFFVDTNAQYVYWGVTSDDTDPSNFRRATLAGVIDPNFVITNVTRTRDIAIDQISQTAYWCDRQTGTIFKRALSGGENQIVISGMNAPHGIALDTEAQKVYWADTGARNGGPFNTSARRIGRCNFDGMEFEAVSTPTTTSEPWDLALDLTSRTYADWRTRFFRASAPTGGPNDDADGDGAVNLLEYAMGTHPGRSASVPRLAAEGTRMRYTRRRGSNLIYRVEVSTDLSLWHYNLDGSGGTWVVQTSATTLTPELESVQVRAGSAASGAQAFFRLRVAMP